MRAQLLLATLVSFAVAFCGLAAHAQDHARLVPDTRARAALGPAAAHGAVIWNHGGEAPRQADPSPAVFVDLLSAQRFDVFRLERRPEGDTIRDSTRALIVAARDVRGRGYQRVVLAGHSAGAWIALAGAASVPALAEAVVALAPAAFGRMSADAVRAQRNRDDLLQMTQAIERTRVLVFLFADDDFDPGDRAAALATRLARQGVDNLVVDRPEGLRGHGVGLTRAFARRYGTCIVGFVTAVRVPTGCEGFPVAEIPFEFPDSLPRLTRVAANDNDPLAPFLGVWRGWLDNGDDVQIVVEGGAVDRVRAVFARGRSRPEARDQAFSVPQFGRFDAGQRAVVFERQGEARIVVRRDAGDRLLIAVTHPGPLALLRGALERQDRTVASGRPTPLSP